MKKFFNKCYFVLCLASCSGVFIISAGEQVITFFNHTRVPLAITPFLQGYDLKPIPKGSIVALIPSNGLAVKFKLPNSSVNQLSVFQPLADGKYAHLKDVSTSIGTYDTEANVAAFHPFIVDSVNNNIRKMADKVVIGRFGGSFGNALSAKNNMVNLR